jgi:hypothetical protein
LGILANRAHTPGEAKQYAFCILHQRLTQIQRHMYTNIRILQLSTELIIVMDFSKFDWVTHHFQDLIVCIYRRLLVPKGASSSSPWITHSYYFHFIGQPQESNDVNFVIAVFNMLNRLGVFSGIQWLTLVSDGGPKHFKLTSFLWFLSHFQQRSNISITYHYFTSYHGQSVCDALAAQGKQQAKAWLEKNNEQRRITTPEQLVSILCTRNGHNAFVVPKLTHFVLEPPTLSGIKGFHKFTFGILFSNDGIPTLTANCYVHSNARKLMKVHEFPSDIPEAFNQLADYVPSTPFLSFSANENVDSCTTTSSSFPSLSLSQVLPDGTVLVNGIEAKFDEAYEIDEEEDQGELIEDDKVHSFFSVSFLFTSTLG